MFNIQPVRAEAPLIPLPTTIPEKIVYYSNQYGVSVSRMNKIIRCESGYNPQAHNPNGENSWGLVQINLKAHKNITIEQATDPDYAINYLAKNLAEGRGSMWTCNK